jgi:hypothetical protein
MTIPRPALDDLRYDDLVEQSLMRLPRLLPAWSDHNASDPGITLIELFAYLLESASFTAAQYEGLARVGFARLLGEPHSDDESLDATLARAVRQLSSVGRAVTQDDVAAVALDGIMVFDDAVRRGHAWGTTVAVNAVGPVTTVLSAQADVGADRLEVRPPAPRLGELVVIGDPAGPADASFVSEVVNGPPAEIRLAGLLRRTYSAGTSVHAVRRAGDPTVLGADIAAGDTAARIVPAGLPPRFVAAVGLGTTEVLMASRLGRAAVVPAISPGEDGRWADVLVVPPGGGPLGASLAQLVYDLLRERVVAATRVFVTEPDYVSLDLDVTVVREAFGLQRTDALRGIISSALRNYLDPVRGGPQGTGWAFGTPVYRAGLNRLLEGIDGVDHVRRLAINGDAASDAWPLAADQAHADRVLVTVNDVRVDVLDATGD